MCVCDRTNRKIRKSGRKRRKSLPTYHCSPPPPPPVERGKNCINYRVIRATQFTYSRLNKFLLSLSFRFPRCIDFIFLSSYKYFTFGLCPNPSRPLPIIQKRKQPKNNKLISFKTSGVVPSGLRGGGGKEGEAGMRFSFLDRKVNMQPFFFLNFFRSFLRGN